MMPWPAALSAKLGRPSSPSSSSLASSPAGDDNAHSRAGDDDADGEPADAPGLQEPRRPAGALYGRSLLDVMAERKAQLKLQARNYVPGSDGRRHMFDRHDLLAGPEDGGAEEPREVEPEHAAEWDEFGGAGDGGPGADVPRRRGGNAPALATRRIVHSIFGPDTLYQRELAEARAREAVERQERETQEELEALRRDELEQRKVRSKLRKGGGKTKRRKGSEEAQVAGLEQDLAFAGGADGSEVPLTAQTGLADDGHDAPANPPPPTRHSIAPSISIPRGLGSGLTPSGSDWFKPGDSDRRDEQEELAAGAGPSRQRSPFFAGEEEDDDDEADAEDARHRPRPLSSLSYGPAGSIAPPGFSLRRSFSFDSEEDAGPSLPAALGNDADRGPAPATRRLPFPGEASSDGHDAASLADTQDDRPLGYRFLEARGQRLPPGVGGPAVEEEEEGGDDTEDDEPIGRRLSRMSLPGISSGPTLSNLAGVAVRTDPERAEECGDDDDEDDAPLGARYSTVLPAGADDIPLALHRLSLAPNGYGLHPARGAPAEQQQATIRPVDDDGRTISAESGAGSDGEEDDRPLGLRTFPTGLQQHPAPPLPLGPFPMGAYPAPGYLPPAASMRFAPPMQMPMRMPVPMAFPAYGGGAFPPGQMPFPGPAPGLGPLPPHPAMAPPPSGGLALAEMQMMQASAASAGPQQTTFGAGASIDRWRKEVEAP